MLLAAAIQIIFPNLCRYLSRYCKRPLHSNTSISHLVFSSRPPLGCFHPHPQALPHTRDCYHDYREIKPPSATSPSSSPLPSNGTALHTGPFFSAETAAALILLYYTAAPVSLLAAAAIPPGSPRPEGKFPVHMSWILSLPRNIHSFNPANQKQPLLRQYPPAPSHSRALHLATYCGLIR
jgi:hypothetical protein